MTKINTLDKTNLRALRADLDLALKSVADKYGIVLRTGTCRFTAQSATMKLDIATIGNGGEVIDVEMSALKANLRFLGLTEAHLKQPFKLGGQTFVLTGYRARRHAKPFSLRCLENGKSYVARENQVKYALGISNLGLASA